MTVALPMAAGATVDAPLLNAYARARLADGDGALDVAVRNYRQALAVDPDNAVVALRSYRRALESGDMALALRSARVLDDAGVLPKDGTLLLAVDALGRKDWVAARRLADRLDAEENFAFLAPLLNSWVSVASGPYAPPVVDGSSRFGGLARRYVDEHMALQALARGRAGDAIPAIDRALAMQAAPLVGLRLTLALQLAAQRHKDKAIALLSPDIPILAKARAALAAGSPRQWPGLSVRPLTPQQGFGRVLARLSDDVASASTRTVALTLARLAIMADSNSAEFQVVLTRQLIAADHAEMAIAEAEKVPAHSLFAPMADDLRTDALLADGQTDAALTLARAIAKQPDAATAQHMRLANILADQSMFDDAVTAYRAAQGGYADGAAPWSLYLLEGSALERGGHWEAARTALNRALALAPEEPVVLNYLGYAQVERRENVAAALVLLRKASALRPNDAAISDSLGWAEYVAGDVRAAVPVLERAAAGAPDNPTINEHLGDALWSAGRRFEARYAWAAAGTVAEGTDAQRIARKVRGGLLPEWAAP